jgi:epoxyqueuosine reductase
MHGRCQGLLTSSCADCKLLIIKYCAACISSRRQELKRLALEAGFDLAGIAGVADTPEHRFFPDWIAAGRSGEMKYLEARNEAGELKRASLANAAPWARSVVVSALNYNTDQPYSTHAGAATQGWISRYAWSQRDYHNVVLEKLRAVEARLIELCGQHEIPLPRTWCYVDTGPVIERIFAKYAGIGWIGKNTCVLNERLGSWLFLGVMLTSLELAPDSASAGPLRLVHALSRCLSHQCFPRSLSTRRDEMHLVSHHRIARLHSGRTSARHRPASLRLRHLPGCLSVES